MRVIVGAARRASALRPACGIRRRAARLAALLLFIPCGVAEGQAPGAVDTLRLDLAGAIEIALERNPALLLGRLDVEQAAAETREARAGTQPRVETNAGFTRDIRPVSPFAGIDVGGALGQQAPTDWLTYNERARTDGDPTTRPLSLAEFERRREAAFDDAGVAQGPGGQFRAAPNQARGGLQVAQPVFSPAATARVRGSRLQERSSLAGLRRQRVETADSVRRAYFAAVLARSRADVLERSAARAAEAVEEAGRRVEQGISPVTDRLATEVEFGNLRTELLQLRLEAERAHQALRLGLGLSPLQPVLLTDGLTVDDGFALAETPLEAALRTARDERSDLEEVRLQIAAQDAFVDATRAQLRPNVTALLDLTVLGNIPDDRTRVSTSPFAPFEVGTERRGPLSTDFWDLGLSAGVQLQWPIFQGGQVRAQVEQARVGVRQAQVRLGVLADAVEAEVALALFEMRAARDRAIIGQENAELAERSYEAVQARLAQGIGTVLERRDASEQLDQARLNLVQALHDYLAARSGYLAAVGRER